MVVPFSFAHIASVIITLDSRHTPADIPSLIERNYHYSYSCSITLERCTCSLPSRTLDINTGIMKLLPTFSEDRSAQTTSLKDIAQDTIGEAYIEEDPSVAEWLCECVPTSHDAAEYVRELFPSVRWLRRYNLHWLAGDAIAGMQSNLQKLLLHTANSRKVSRSVLLWYRKPWLMRRSRACHLLSAYTRPSQARVYTGSSGRLETSS